LADRNLANAAVKRTLVKDSISVNLSDSATAVFDSPVGPLFARADAGSLTELSFISEARRVRLVHARADGIDNASRDVVNAVKFQIQEYFERRLTKFDIPILLQGPSFHLRVWEALRAIPYGATLAYGEVASRLGEPDAARAVGAANGANPVVIIVPCHRVIGANGRLVGYGGGLHRKRVLLDLESGRPALDLTSFDVDRGL
jgi:methylated-DNA-[protein]-cysteine S-methyltransferase